MSAPYPKHVVTREEIVSALTRTIERNERFMETPEAQPYYEAIVQVVGALKVLREELEGPMPETEAK